MSSNIAKRLLSFITSIVFIFVSVSLSVGLMTEEVYAASAFSQIEAESKNSCTSGISTFTVGSGTAVGSIKNGYYMAYNNIEFGTGASSFKAKVATNSDTTIQIMLGSTSGPTLGNLKVSSTGSFDNYQEISCTINGATGTNNVYLVFGGPVNIDWFIFTPASTATATSSSVVKFEAENRNEATSSIKSYSGATGTVMGNISSSCYMAYYGIELGSGITSFKTYAATNKDTTIEIRTENLNGPVLGYLNVASTGSFDTYKEMSCSVTGASGRKNVYLVFSGPVNLDWCSFTLVSTAATTYAPTPTWTPASRSAFSQLQAESYNASNSSAIQSFGISDGTAIGYIIENDYLLFNNIDFGSGASSFKARVATQTETSIEIRSGSASGTLLSTLTVTSTGSWDTYQEMSCSVNISEKKDLYLVFKGPLNFDWFMFTPTTSTAPRIDAFSQIEAENCSSVSSSNIKKADLPNGNQMLCYIQTDNYIVFNNVDFGGGAASFKAKGSNASGSTTDIQLRLGSSTGTQLGTLSVPSTSSWDEFQELSCNISNISGSKKDLYLVFTGPFNFDWLKFSSSGIITPTVTPTPATTVTPSTSSTTTATSTTTPTTPTPTPTVALAPSFVPTAATLDATNFSLARKTSVRVEIGSTETISEVQSGKFNINGLGTIKADKEMVLLVDNSKSSNYININNVNPLDFAIFSGGDLSAGGTSLKVIGDVGVNNILTTNVSTLEQIGSCYAKGYRVGYGCKITGNAEILASPLPMPSFREKLIDEAKASSLVFDPDNYTTIEPQDFPGQPDFNIRYESNNNLFIVTCDTGSEAVAFNLTSSMYFMGNVQISVKHIENTGSCFLVADGYVKLEGHNVYTGGSTLTPPTPDLLNLNVYSIHGKIWIATENAKISGLLYAEGDATNDLYTKDIGVVSIQGMSNDIYGSVVAGGLVETNGRLSTYTYSSELSSIIEKKYINQTTQVTTKELAKRIVDKLAGSDIKVGALQYSDSANVNTFELYDLSKPDGVTELKKVIDKFPTTTSGDSNLGDALRRGRHLFYDTKKSSPFADKYFVVLAASLPNKWTGDDVTPTIEKDKDGDAVNIFGNGTIGKALTYAINSANKAKSDDIKTAFVDSSLTDISTNIEQLATQSGAAIVEAGRHYFNNDSLTTLSALKRFLYYGIPKMAVLKNASYEETFPAGIEVKEDADSKVEPVEVDGVIRHKITRSLDLNLTYDGTNYEITPYTVYIKVSPKKLGDITFLGTDSKITYTVEYLDVNGKVNTITFEKNFNDITMNVFMGIDIG